MGDIGIYSYDYGYNRQGFRLRPKFGGFDADGRVLIHKDFWDSGTGLHEQLPVIGGAVRRVRAAVEKGAG